MYFLTFPGSLRENVIGDDEVSVVKVRDEVFELADEVEFGSNSILGGWRRTEPSWLVGNMFAKYAHI